MARPMRLEFEGAVYHVTSRGQERGKVFADDADREAYLEGLARVVEEKQWILHGYCLMTNHVHLLVETPAGNLSAGMHLLHGGYSQAYNRRHGRTGHLFEGRFHAVLVEKEAHLLELARYLVLNPVRARMAKSPGAYRWSSYRATAGEAPEPSWLETRWTLEQLGSSRRAREAYRRFVAEGKGLPSPLEKVTGQIYLGSGAFLAEVERRLQRKKPDSAVPRVQRRAGFVPVERVKEAVAEAFHVDVAALGRSRGGADKVAAIYLARLLSGLGGTKVGEAFGVTPGRVSHVMKQVRAGDWPDLAPTLEKLEKALRK